MKYVKACARDSCLPRFDELNRALEVKQPYEFMFLNSFTPDDSHRRYDFLQSLERTGCKFPIVVMTHSSGNNAGNIHFIWRVPPTEEADVTLRLDFLKNFLTPIKCDISFFSGRDSPDEMNVTSIVNLPKFHTRAMRVEMFTKFGLVSPGVKPAALRFFYRSLTGDASAPNDITEAEIDSRVQEVIDMEPDDPQTVFDLREAHKPTGETKYQVFWDEAAKFINEDIGTAVDDRRHASVTHLTKAISIHDFREQVKARVPEETAIPSDEWLRLQFWPKAPKTRVGLQHTGRLKVQYMVQQRQFRKSHPDEHYASAIFRYLHQFAIKYKEESIMAAWMTNTKSKWENLAFPVAAVERGKRVLVKVGASFEVGDHDFTKFSLVPSVTLVNDIPTEITGSWYSGQVFFALKEGAFEPSSPIRHVTELISSLEQLATTKPMLLLYTNGGPDHRLTYLSVQVALIALFRRLDLDYLCAARTAPCHSWKNPVEHVMSIFNLGLQSVGLMREDKGPEYEEIARKCNNLSDLRAAAEKNPEFKSLTLDSIASVKVLLTQLFERLQLKDVKFKPTIAASEDSIDEIWKFILEIEPSLVRGESLRKEHLPQKEKLKQYLEHCCTCRHFFVVKKCGSSTCEFCDPPRLPKGIFSSLHVLPDPIPGEEGHYKEFSEVYGTTTTESYRPSLQKKSKKAKTLPFASSLRHVNNVDMMLECEHGDYSTRNKN